MQGNNYPSGRGKGRGFHQSQRGRNNKVSYRPPHKNGSYSHQFGSHNHQFNHQTYPQTDNAKSTCKDECLACGGKGHWAKECPTKRKQNKRGTFNPNKTRAFTRPNGQYRTVNHVSEENHSDTDAKKQASRDATSPILTKMDCIPPILNNIVPNINVISNINDSTFLQTTLIDEKGDRKTVFALPDSGNRAKCILQYDNIPKYGTCTF
jgi:hypothetical protein